MSIQRVLISMPDKFLEDIDQVANEENRSRSELIREALRVYMRKLRTIDKLMKDQQNASKLEELLQ